MFLFLLLIINTTLIQPGYFSFFCWNSEPSALVSYRNKSKSPWQLKSFIELIAAKKQHFNFQFSHSTLTSSFNTNFPFKHQMPKSKSSLKVSFNCQLQMLVSNFKFIYIYTSILNSNIILHQFKLQIQSSNSIFSFQP